MPGPTHPDLDARFMGKALRVARRGRPSPNPHVGAVIARGSRLLATGYHRKAGADHAEVMALARCGSARGATVYVTLEPCNHFGRTPPCTDALIAAKVGRVVIGCRDPAPHVPGAIERLEAAGIAVTVGVREAEAAALVADFAKHITKGLPMVTLKAAVTLDGRLATRTGDSKWITGPEARKEAHRLRDRSDAVLVGVGTVIADDPELTVRAVRGRNPLRVVLDSRLRTPSAAKLVRAPVPAGTLFFHGPEAPRRRREALTRQGVEVVEVKARGGRLDLSAVLKELGRRDVVRLLVEGGATVHGAFLDAGQADRLAIFVAPTVLGDAQALPLADGAPRKRIVDAYRLSNPRVQTLGDDVLIQGFVDPDRRRSEAKRGQR